MIHFELTDDQLEKMKLLREYHIKNHKELQPLQAIQEFCELSQVLTKYLIDFGLNRDVNYLIIYNELFDAFSLMLTMYQIFVKDVYQEKMFRLIADKKIRRELTRWGVLKEK